MAKSRKVTRDQQRKTAKKIPAEPPAPQQAEHKESKWKEFLTRHAVAKPKENG